MVLALVALIIGLGVVPKPLLGVTEAETAVLVPRSSTAGSPAPAAGGTTAEAGGP